MDIIKKFFTLLSDYDRWDADVFASMASSFFSFLLAVITIISVGIALKAYMHQRKRAAKESACNLAKFYAEVVMDQNKYITTALKLSDISKDITNCFPKNKLNKFNFREMESLLAHSDLTVDEFRNKFDSIKSSDIFFSKMFLCKSTSDNDFHDTLKFFLTNVSNDNDEIKEAKNQIENLSFISEIGSLLNYLEWFAMNFNYKVADETLVYQSLHQSYLDTIQLFYFFICQSNKNGGQDKYYTNIIWLYKKWNTRLNKMKQKQLRRNSNPIIKVIKHFLDKIENSEPTYTGKSL